MTTTTETAPKLDVYSIVTNRIIELLKQGTLPWKKPWGEAGLPMNLVSKRQYRGLNVWLLLSLNYAQNLFLTWEQLKKLGGSVKQGEHGHIVIFWKTVTSENEEPENGTEKKKLYSLLRYYKVFNVSQCTGIPESMIPKSSSLEFDPILECEAIMRQMPLKPAIKHKDQQAYYHVVEDYVNMPAKKSFVTKESYYSTLFHELVHSTGHPKRLNRKSIAEMAEFGSEPYSMEELIAELGACYLISSAGLENTDLKSSTAYIAGWLKKLEGDKRFIVFASGFAQKAADYILNVADSEIEETSKE